ncbi:MAG: 16S rRNA (guanine(527)-N(7))-methyltransferase RsmG [Armatimonadota bacterium]|nr:16S rRNA (guanine(527)-N(7))-methyltransferase RsmG [Armatimonadota bacterium]MDW8155648.1 16S rRNA (guanine(527)-N(7))-methyltransferase RsmG [Armatimonadota bacterium]
MELEEACRALGLVLSDRQRAQLLGYRDLLARWNVRVDLVAPASVEEILRAHVLDSLLLLVMVRPPQGGSVADVGSGAGLPGLVWAVARPDLQVVLLEPRKKRAAFAERAAVQLQIPNVQVEALRAEEACTRPQYQAKFDVVVARAVAAPAVVLRMARRLLRGGGRLAVPVGPGAAVSPPFHEVACRVPWDPQRTRRVAVFLA